MLELEEHKHQWQWVYQRPAVMDFIQSLKKIEIVHLIGPMLHHRLMDVPLQHIHGPNHAFIFVDGGVHIKKDMLSLGIKQEQTISLGDGDSADIELDLKLPRDKDYSDLTVALDLLRFWISDKKQLKAWGFFGGRLDHQMVVLGNFSNVLTQIKENIHIELFTSFQDDSPAMICLPAGRHEVAVQGPFSLISLLANKVQLTGSCRYLLRELTILNPLSDLGLSNEGFGMIQIICHQPLWLMKHNSLEKGS